MSYLIKKIPIRLKFELAVSPLRLIQTLEGLTYLFFGGKPTALDKLTKNV
jgi:hypothetical protein